MPALTRRKLFKSVWLLLPGIFLGNSFLRGFPSAAWAKAKKILPKEFSKDDLKEMNPSEVDSRNLEIDPLDNFGTMGPTDMTIDVTSYRLKLVGGVERPLSLSYDQIIKYPSVTETVLLICPGFFANNGRWTGVDLKFLLHEAKAKREAKYIDIKGAHEKVVRIPLVELVRRRIFLAYRVNGETLPKRHGFPLRLVFEDAYGYDWVKYVSDLVVT